ncbi:MAG: acetyltransferase [Methanosphaera sp. rholeuAM130]|nr:MAG: acetyltransferase [Methanosphaera sp. rholeuAM130]
MTELEKYEKGLSHCFDDEEIIAKKENAVIECMKYNSIDPLDSKARYRQLKLMLADIGEKVTIESNFNVDNGKHIHIGDNFIGNYNLTILDINHVYIADNVMIGPNTVITTVGHPLDPKGRREHVSITGEVHIGSDVWIGANVTVLPGVTIGDNVVVGAGAVVNRDIPSNSLAVGVPAKVIRKLENNVDD